eukprot:m.196902 g.196902  ORF g.196902 m.196902 type:complete len:50 (+) comp32637_c7_seq5:56-205(+)
MFSKRETRRMGLSVRYDKLDATTTPNTHTYHTHAQVRLCKSFVCSSMCG